MNLWRTIRRRSDIISKAHHATRRNSPTAAKSSNEREKSALGSASPRRAALRALVSSEADERPFSAALDEQEAGQGRAFAHEIGAGALRHRSRLDWTLAPLLKKPIARLDSPVRVALRLALYETVVLKTAPHVVANEYAGLMREEKLASAVAFVNAVARRLPIDWRVSPSVERDALTHLAIEYSHPEWLLRRWIARFGFDGCRDLCAINNTIAPLSLRANTMRAERDEIVSGLRERGLQARASAISPHGIVVSQAGSPLDWPQWIRGEIIAQDEAAQLVSLLAAPAPNQIVIDVAAAPGGKTTHLAQLMNDCGRIIAADRAPGRLKLVSQNARRLGLKSVEIFAADVADLARAVRDGEREKADIVLLDAPCLGTGTLRRRPDARWKKTPAMLEELVALQREMLEDAAVLVAPHGALIYATCSLEAEENEMQAQWWLETHDGWRVESPAIESAPFLNAPWLTADGWLQTLPQRDGCDGMFAVKLRRTD